QLMKEFEYNEAPSTKRRLTKDERERKLQALRGMHGGVTASHLPGTTLGLTELSLDNGLDEIGPLFETEINSYGLSWDRACTDVVLAGLGWVALTGLGDVTVRVLAPEGVGVMQREPLMPFEARTSTESYKGSGDKRGTSRRTKSLQFANPRRGRGYGSPSR
ncbi:hypothetical protein T484DRAFT_1945465, partial [Baffinella frigidus]